MDAAAPFLAPAMVIALSVGLASLVFGSPAKAWRAIVLVFTKGDPDA